MRWSSVAPPEVFCKDFVDISYGNVLFLMLVCFPLGKMELLYDCSLSIIIWFVECLFPIDEDT